jgi:hypothetical protein
MRYPLVYGGIAGAIIIGIALIVIGLDLPKHFETPWFGYLVMLVALSLIFVGVRRYRDSECGGVVSFGRAFKLGLAMALVAALIYIAGWELYLALSGKDFMAEYSGAMIESMRADGASAAAMEAAQAEMRDFGAKYRNPLFRVPITFAEIFPVGFIVALVSAALLRNPRLLPARTV